MLNINIGNDLVDLSALRTNCKNLDLRFVNRVFSNNEQFAIKKSIEPSTTLWAIWAAKEAAFKACQQFDNNLIFAHKKFAVADESLCLLASDWQHIALEKQNFPIQKTPTTQINKELFGLLQYKNFLCHIKWQFFKNFIHCLAVLNINKSNFNTPHNSFKYWHKIGYNIFKIVPKHLSLNQETLENIKNNFTQQELNSIFSQESLQTRYYAKKFISSCYNKPENFLEIIRPHIIVNKSQRLGPPFIKFNNDNIKINTSISLTHDGFFGAVAAPVDPS